MAATTIHLTLLGTLAALVSVASCIMLVASIVERLLGKLTPRELAAVTIWERIKLAAFVVFLAIGPFYLIHLASKGACS